MNIFEKNERKWINDKFINGKYSEEENLTGCFPWYSYFLYHFRCNQVFLNTIFSFCSLVIQYEQNYYVLKNKMKEERTIVNNNKTMNSS